MVSQETNLQIGVAVNALYHIREDVKCAGNKIVSEILPNISELPEDVAELVFHTMTHLQTILEISGDTYKHFADLVEGTPQDEMQAVRQELETHPAIKNIQRILNEATLNGHGN